MSVYIYSTGFIFFLDGSGLRLNSAETPSSFTITSDNKTGLDGLKSSKNWLNISANGVVTLSPTFQNIDLYATGAMTTPINGTLKYISISSEGKVVLTDTFNTVWQFMDYPNTTMFSNVKNVGIYNTDQMSYFPYDYKELAKLYKKPECEGDFHCYIKDSKGGNVCKTSMKNAHACAGKGSYNQDGLTYMGCDPGNKWKFEDDHSYFYRQNNDSNVENCAAGDPTTLIDGKLNQCICELGSEQIQLQNYCFNNTGANGCKVSESKTPLKNQAFAPWSVDVKDSDTLKKFCAQHDTYTEGPYLFTDSRCLNWASEDPRRAGGAMDRYCNVNPDSMFCADFCATQADDGTTCKFTMKNYCSDFDNINSPVCKEWCKNINVDCDASLNKYCTSKLENGNKSPADLSEEDAELCACFLPNDFYVNYIKSLKEKVTIPPEFPALKQCFYGACAASTIKPLAVKKGKGVCPDIQACIQDIKFTNTGTITGAPITFDQNNACHFYTPLTYDWDTSGDWSDCSASGFRTRTVLCKDNKGTIHMDDDDKRCCKTETCIDRPETVERGCIPAPPFKWQYGVWGTCEGKVQPRSVECIDNKTKKPAGYENCLADDMPTSSRPCSIEKTYEWDSGQYVDCVREVWCKNSVTQDRVNDSYCSAPARPKEKAEGCIPPSKYKWSEGPWEKICKNDQYFRPVQCVLKSTGSEASSEKLCTDPKPAEYKPCNSSDFYVWKDENMDECGPNKKITSIYSCYDKATKSPVDDDLCSIKDKPVNKARPCTRNAFISGNWGECINSSQKRTVECQGKNEFGVLKYKDDKDCIYSDLKSKPETTQTCEVPSIIPWMYIGIFGGVLVLIIVAIVIFIKRKKKT